MATVAEALNIALDHHLAGRVEEARTLYSRILDVDPDNPHALHLLGLLLAQTGGIRDAIPLIQKAIRGLPSAAEFHVNLGKAQQALGLSAEAVAAFHNAVLLSPESGGGWYFLAGALLDHGEFERCETALRRAQAVEAIGTEPSAVFADAYERLGMGFYGAGNWSKAVAAFRTFHGLAPDRADAPLKLGAALAQAGDLDAAISALRAAVARDASLSDAQLNLCHLLTKRGCYDESERAGRAAVASAPDNPAAYGNMVPLLEQTGRIDEAMALCDRALRLSSGAGRGGFHVNRLSLLLHYGRIDDAVAAGRDAVRCTPDNADAHLGLSVALLARGDYAEGWEEFEWRWKTSQLEPPVHSTTHPLWTGGDIAGRTILLHAEQGLGDTLQFIRYAPLVARRGARVVVGCQPGLARLMGRVEGVAEVISWGENLPSLDVQCPFMSLPRAFGTRLDSIPNHVPYLHADSAEVEAWWARLPRDGRLRVGIVWAGASRPVDGVASPTDRRRSVPLSAFAPLGDVAGVHLISLQKGGGAEQLNAAPAGLRLTDPMDAVQDFADTAALVETLDLVITVDTSVAHLAGGLGKPVWLLSRADACWRWLGNRESNPWYPTVRVFGQERSGDWTGVVKRVRRELISRAASPA